MPTIQEQFIELQKQLKAKIEAPPAVPEDTSPREVSAEVTVICNEPARNVADRLREIYAIAKAAHAEIYQALKVLEQQQPGLPVEQLVDCIFALRETENLLEDSRRMCSVANRSAQGITCAKHALNPLAEKSITGEFCKGYPDIKMRALVPTFAKDPERYNQLCDYLGIPEDLRDHGPLLVEEGEFKTKVVDIDWNGFQSLIQRQRLMGYETLPPGIKENEQFAEATVRCVKSKDLL